MWQWYIQVRWRHKNDFVRSTPLNGSKYSHRLNQIWFTYFSSNLWIMMAYITSLHYSPDDNLGSCVTCFHPSASSGQRKKRKVGTSKHRAFISHSVPALPHQTQKSISLWGWFCVMLKQERVVPQSCNLGLWWMISCSFIPFFFPFYIAKPRDHKQDLVQWKRVSPCKQSEVAVKYFLAAGICVKEQAPTESPLEGSLTLYMASRQRCREHTIVGPCPRSSLMHITRGSTLGCFVIVAYLCINSFK